jgi:ADP-heptose:LPS heptosyltransferase
MSRRTVSPRWLVASDTMGSPQPPARVLVHQSRFHVGDALWLTPLLRNVRRAFPDAEVTVVAGPLAAPVFSRSPHVSNLMIWDPAGGDAERERVLAELGRRRFDAALFALVRRDKSRWLAEAVAAAGVPWRVNLEYLDGTAVDGEIPRPDGLFTHEAWFVWGLLPSPQLLLHALSPWLGESGDWLEDRRVEMPVTAAERAAAERVLAEAGIGDGRFAVLAPAGHSSDRWPPERFAEIGRRLVERLDCPVLIEGAPSDAPLLREVERGIGRPDRARAATDPLGVLTALLGRARLLVSNDSAPIHLAEAAGTPTLYFAHREKLQHSHPAGPFCRSLWDERENRPAEIPVERTWDAILQVWGQL